jgi:hypothetical protein
MMNRIVKIISNTIYGIGVAFVIACVAGVFFGKGVIPHPESLFRITLQDIAALCLAIGSIPMILACMAVYKFNCIKTTPKKKRNFILIFLPGFICAASVLIFIILLIFFYIYSFIFRANSYFFE